MLTKQIPLVEFRLPHGRAAGETRRRRGEVDVLHVLVGGRGHWVVGIGDRGRPEVIFIISKACGDKLGPKSAQGSNVTLMCVSLCHR